MSGIMKTLTLSLALSLAFAGHVIPMTAFAQDERPEIRIAPLEPIIIPEEDSETELEPESIIDSEEALETADKKPDYSDLTEEAERSARLEALFKRLKDETNAEDANLVAEEIWAIWLDSGSDTVNFILRRGTAAQKRNDNKLARRMYDHVTALNPDYAEGWARSSRLALEEKDLSRALNEAAQALIYEPRHFYALWTMGNVFEQLGRQDEALEAYREANKLYPELKAVKDRLGTLQSDIDGDVL